MFSNGFDGEAGLVPVTAGSLGMIVVRLEDSAHPTGSTGSRLTLLCYFATWAETRVIGSGGVSWLPNGK